MTGVAAFDGPLITSDEFGLPFTLYRPLGYYSVLLARLLTLPIGFKTTLASIPRLLQSIIPAIGRYDRAAAVHDYLYAIGGMTQAMADAVLLEAMVVLRVHPIYRWLIYRGVRLGGGYTWRRYRAADAEQRVTGRRTLAHGHDPLWRPGDLALATGV